MMVRRIHLCTCESGACTPSLCGHLAVECPHTKHKQSPILSRTVQARPLGALPYLFTIAPAPGGAPCAFVHPFLHCARLWHPVQITPLFLAAQRGHMEACRLLVENGANPLQPCYIQGTAELCTPQQVASLNLHLKVRERGGMGTGVVGWLVRLGRAGMRVGRWWVGGEQ